MTQIPHPLPRPHGRLPARPAHRAGSNGRLRGADPPPVNEPVWKGAELSIEICRAGAQPVVSVSGDLDLAGKELLEAVIAHVRDSHRGYVAVDLGQVSFADTHGLSPALQQDVVLVAASPAVRRLLRLLDLPGPDGGARPLRRGVGRRGHGPRPAPG